MSTNTNETAGICKPIPNQCKYFVVRKKRYCRMLVKESEAYCCEHQLFEDDGNKGELRIPCPFDNKHTCYAHKLDKHLKICNAKPKELDPFIVKGINSGCDNTNKQASEEIPPTCLTNKSPLEIMSCISRVNKIFEDEKIEIIENNCYHKVVEDEMKNPIYGNKTKKHLKQVSSILGLLAENGFLNSDTCYIEFGAGRGALSYWIAKAEANAKILLIEKASPKHKKDNKLTANGNIKRIRADIADLVLDRLDLIQHSKVIVGVTKHLCGAATDFSIRCLTNLSLDKKIGFLMTFCCHHRCTWSSFTGRKYFQEVSLSESDFEIMCCMTSWATCGSGLSREKNADNARTETTPKDFEYSENALGLTVQQKEEIGLRCKNLINWGRLKFLNNAGYNSSLTYYVGKDITPENVCIIASNKKH